MKTKTKKQKIEIEKALKARKIDYNNYLLGDLWKNKKKEAFMFHGEFCKRCKATKYLEVHHMTYVRFKNEIMADLCILCKMCHKTYHQTYKERPSVETTEHFCNTDGVGFEYNPVSNSIFKFKKFKL